MLLEVPRAWHRSAYITAHTAKDGEALANVDLDVPSQRMHSGKPSVFLFTLEHLAIRAAHRIFQAVDSSVRSAQILTFVSHATMEDFMTTRIHSFTLLQSEGYLCL